MSDFTKAVAVAKSYTDKHSGGLPDAPIDGQLYGRENGEWVVIEGFVPKHNITVSMIGSLGNIPVGNTVMVYMETPTGELLYTSFIYEEETTISAPELLSYKITGTTDIQGFVNPNVETGTLTEDVEIEIEYKEFGDIQTWADVQELTRYGVLGNYMEIGDEMTFTKDGQEITAVLMHIMDANKVGSIKIKDPTLTHGAIFQTKDCITSMQFDNSEALYGVDTEDDILTAGTYNFTVSATSSKWYAGTYQFTLTQDLVIGNQLKISGNNGTELTSLNMDVYANDHDNTKVESVPISSGSEGESIGSIPALNHPDRMAYGNNRWKLSALRQWLNSNAVAGQVWHRTHPADRAPSWYSNTKGFMNGIDEDFLDCVAEVEIDTYRNTVTDGGGLDTTDETFFLIGNNEAYCPTEGADNGVAFDYYKEGSQYDAPSGSADPIRIKKWNGSASWWWWRSPYVGHARNVRDAYDTGERDHGPANTTYGVAPAFVIA